jgi:hypothetical protein
MMECYCDYDDVADAWIVTMPKARKRHKCYECYGPILPGEVYKRVGSLFDGHWETYKTCPRCLAIIDYVDAHIPCFKRCLLAGGLYEDGGAKETVEYYADKAPGLAFGLGRLLVAKDRFNEAHREKT